MRMGSISQQWFAPSLRFIPIDSMTLNHATKAICRQAMAVLADCENYPTCVVTLARSIEQRYQQRRHHVTWVWENRQLLHQFIRYRNASKAKLAIDRRRDASLRMQAQYGVKALTVLHQYRSSLTDCRYDALVLEQMVRLIELQSHGGLLQYIVDVNEGRSLNVSNECYQFGVSIGRGQMIEILCWKLARLEREAEPDNSGK